MAISNFVEFLRSLQTLSQNSYGLKINIYFKHCLILITITFVLCLKNFPNTNISGHRGVFEPEELHEKNEKKSY